jgi:quercetin dioxygenase-like cupin family protein
LAAKASIARLVSRICDITIYYYGKRWQICFPGSGVIVGQTDAKVNPSPFFLRGMGVRKRGTKRKRVPVRNRGRARTRLTPRRDKRGLRADDMVLAADAPEVAQLTAGVTSAGGAAIGACREPLSGRPMLLAALPIAAVQPHPAGRVGVPEDIAALVDYLISKEAAFITGANFVVDGGMTRRMIYAEWGAMVLQVEHWNTDSDGKLSEPALRKKLAGRGYSVTRYVYPPGTYFPPHTHDEDKIDAVLSGRFRLRMQGESALLEAGDALAVPRGTVHSAEVVGDQPVVSLDAVRLWLEKHDTTMQTIITIAARQREMLVDDGGQAPRSSPRVYGCLTGRMEMATPT